MNPIVENGLIAVMTVIVVVAMGAAVIWENKPDTDDKADSSDESK